ncbi:hypothetical protein JKP88DRAFT_251709 [Tribonema minus]|uniref:Uncharacterized protein n=1 Tax=Tribonema minus TaxID=303371 RepID=A0A836CN49_9STRA|nr:hypothetical protein JKP88DRAFT_251709 [Tribonema minus]
MSSSEMEAILRVQSDLFALMYRYTTTAVHGVFYDMYAKLSKLHDNDDDVCSHLQWAILRTHLWSAKIVSTVAAPWSRIARDCIVLMKKLAKCNVKILALSGFSDADDEHVDIHVTFPEVLHAVLTSASRVVSINMHCIMTTDTSQISNLMRQHHVVEDAVANLCKDHLIEATPEAVKLRSISQKLEADYKKREEELERKAHARVAEAQLERERLEASQRALAQMARSVDNSYDRSQSAAEFSVSQRELAHTVDERRRRDAEAAAVSPLEDAQTRHADDSNDRHPSAAEFSVSQREPARTVDERRRRAAETAAVSPLEDAQTRHADDSYDRPSSAAEFAVSQRELARTVDERRRSDAETPVEADHVGAAAFTPDAVAVVTKTDPVSLEAPTFAAKVPAPRGPSAEPLVNTAPEPMDEKATVPSGSPETKVPAMTAAEVGASPVADTSQRTNPNICILDGAKDAIRIELNQTPSEHSSKVIKEEPVKPKSPYDHNNEHARVGSRTPPNSPPSLAAGGGKHDVSIEDYIAQRIRNGIAQQELAMQNRNRRSTQVHDGSNKSVSVPTESEYERLRNRYLSSGSESDLDVEYI